MSLKINIDTNFHHLADYMDDIGNDGVTSAARSALNNAIRRGRDQGSAMMKRKRLGQMNKGEIKKRIRQERAKGGNLSTLVASLEFSGIPISMLQFVVGNKKPIQQEGKAIKKRRKLSVRLRGRKIRLQGAFIQDIKSKQVFRHKGKGRRARTLKTKSLARIAMEEKWIKTFENIVEGRFKRQFENQVRWRWSKAAKEFNRKPMRRL